MFSKLEFDDENGTCKLKNFPADHFFTTIRTNKYPFNIKSAQIVPEHSDKIRTISNVNKPSEMFLCDGLMTAASNLALTLYTADCFPMMMSSSNREFIGLIHAGWRGTDKEIVRKAVKTATKIYGIKSEDILVGIGPGIRACCYSSGNLLEIFMRDERWHPFIISSKFETRINLLDFNVKQLLDAGINPDNISTSIKCTCCSKDKDENYIFHSHYRSNQSGTKGKKEGRNKTIIAVF